MHIFKNILFKIFLKGKYKFELYCIETVYNRSTKAKFLEAITLIEFIF